MRNALLPVAALVALVAIAAPVQAADDEFDVWLNPAFTVDLDDRTGLELETAQRFREAPADDTYFFRLWVNRELADGVELSLGAERRFEGADDEVRLLQQLSYELAGFDLRTRLEQRFVSSDPQTIWRFRQRVGAGVPLGGGEEGWQLVGNVEGFFTLRAGTPDGQTGLTGLRTFVGFERSFRRFDLSVGYLRQQDIRRGAEDRVGHAPQIGITVKL